MMAQALINAGANVNYMDHKGTALIALIIPARYGNRDIVDELLAAGAINISGTVTVGRRRKQLCLMAAKKYGNF